MKCSCCQHNSKAITPCCIKNSQVVWSCTKKRGHTLKCLKPRGLLNFSSYYFCYHLNFTSFQLRAQFVLLLCELTASPTIYKINAESEYLLQNANQLLGKLFCLCRKCEHAYIFNYYEQKLHKDSWKRQLGAVHGFVRYLEVKQHSESVVLY